jgi:hypothetical protein
MPVTIAAESDVEKAAEASDSASVQQCAGSITIEFPGRTLLSIEGVADPAMIRAVLESQAR